MTSSRGRCASWSATGIDAARRGGRAARHLLVDEAQDLDRAQLRLALLLAAPANRIFLVGDDDQSIYGWRLADVRRLLGLADEALPGLTRVDLETNYRCPAVVLERAVRLIEHNVERFDKVIRAGPNAAGRLVLAPSAADDVDRAAAVLASWPDDGGTRAVLARTNRELAPGRRRGAPAGHAVSRGRTFACRSSRHIVDALLDDVHRHVRGGHPLVALGRRRRARASSSTPTGRRRGRPAGPDDPDAIAAALLGWAAAARDPC